MREIKFRAWNKITNHFSDFVNEHKIEDINSSGSIIFMQYTGLKDKNGVEIYEGDILKQVSSDGESILHIVKYDDNDANFIAKNLKLGDDYACGINKNWLLKKEVIGNIYENPELLN